MNLVDRIKNILLTPQTEWPKIAGEQSDVKSLYTSYIMVLAAIPAAVQILSVAVFAQFFGTFAMGSMAFGSIAAILGYVLGLAMVYVVALVADALAESFDGEKNFLQAFKLVTYSMTASWVGAIFGIIPILGWLLSFLASLYGIFIFYNGVTTMMKVPEAKAIGYTVVVIIAAIVVGAVIGTITGVVVMAGTMGAVGLGGRSF
jgi:hypothetical protein